MKIYGDVPASQSFRQNYIKLNDAICKKSWMYDFFYLHIYEWESGF